jgi:hypothetical protein
MSVSYKTLELGNIEAFYRGAGPESALVGLPAFIPAGAEAYKRDLPDAEVHQLDNRHFAL